MKKNNVKENQKNKDINKSKKIINSTVLKRAKTGKIYDLLFSILFLFLAVGSIIYGNIYTKKDVIPYLYSVKKEGYKANINVNIIPYAFAKSSDEEVTNKLYFVMDNNKFMYIVYLDQDTYTKISNTENLKDEGYILTGSTHKIPDKIKELAISVYNKSIEEDLLNEDNFENYFGTMLLDTISNYDDAKVTHVSMLMFYGLALLFLLVSISFFLVFLRAKIITKKVLEILSQEDIDLISKELVDKSTKSYKRKGIYLTKDYLISTCYGLTIIDYKNIFWFYKEKIKRYFVTVGTSIVIYDRDLNGCIYNFKTFGRQNKVCNEIYKILEKNATKALVGKSEDVVKKVAEIYEKRQKSSK